MWIQLKQSAGKSINVGVFFEKENIWTLDSKGEFVLTLMAGFAQEEARSLSENTAWGIRRRMESGKYWVAYSRFVGYGPGFEIEDDGADVVRRIFKYTIQGYSSTRIASLLEESGILTPANGTHWHGSTVMSILKNEKYKGDALSQKYFIEDFLTKKKIKNRGELPQYYVTGVHEPIIPPELFDYTQEVLNLSNKLNIRKCGSTLMSNKLICGKCGASYGLHYIHSNDKYGLIETVCQTEALDTEKEQLEQEMAIIAENLTNLIRENASVALNQEEQSGKEDKLRTLYGEKHDRFQKLETLIQEKNDTREILMDFISKLKDLTGEQTEFREELWGGLVDYIRVDSEKSSTVVFRGGIEIKTES